MKKKKLFHLACCLAAACGMFAFSGCSVFIESIFGEDSSQEKSYAEDEWNPQEDAQGGSSSSKSESETDGEEREDVAQPDPDKELLRTEIGEFGHKIAYYTDGSSEDLGRATPMDLTPSLPETKMGYQYLASQEKGDGLCAFYQEIFTVARNFHASDKNVTVTDGHYEIADMRFSQHGLTNDEAVSVWRAVSLEYPEFFWWGNSLLLGSTSLSFLVDPLYAQASERASAQSAIEEMAEACDKYVDGTTSTVERALTVHDYVTGLTTYAYEDDYVTPESEIWAHNIAGGAQYGKGVCETYAKTYAYLCQLFDLPCITVTGFAVQDGESFGHAWNAVQIDDGWYLVDATWNDLDSKTLSREWFGTEPEKFAQSHDPFTPEDGWSVNYMFALPTLDEDGLTPVRAARAEELAAGKYTAENAPMYPSIEDVCALLDEGISYEAYLYPRTAATAQGVDVWKKGATLHRVPHTAGTLAINGAYSSLLGDYFEIAELSSTEKISFLGDVILRDVSYEVPSIDLCGNLLTTGGTAVEIATLGTLSGGDLTDETTKWTELTAVDLDTVTARGKELCLLGGGAIVHAALHSGMLRLHGVANTTIGTLWYATENERLYIDGATGSTTVTVGDITAGTPANAEQGEAATFPEKVNVFVVYSSASTYPLLRVAKKSTEATLRLTMYSEYLMPQRLGKAFINLGADVALTSLSVCYPWNGSTHELKQTYYEKQANGDVCWK